VNRTVRALVQRGFDTHSAESFHREGYTLGKLQGLTAQELDDLGISSTCQEALKGRRPPIPEKTLYDLLYHSSHICCVCHDPERGVIVHHIEPWAKSGSHDEQNLAVLCPLCHDKAHTKSSLTRGLTPSHVRHHKNEWQKKVSRDAAKALFKARPHSISGGFWDYFNRQRLLDCANGLNINLAAIPGCNTLLPNDGGLLDRTFRWAGTVRCGTNNEYSFFSSLLRTVCEQRDWIDLDRIWTRSQVRSLLMPNTLIALTGNHRFRMGGGPDHGPGQVRTGYLRRKGIRLEFSFDPWECTSSSSYTHHLRGQWLCTSLGFVRSVTQPDGRLQINSTCLAIGTGFMEYVDRTPVVAYTHGRLGEEADDEI